MIADLTLTIPDFWLGVLTGIGATILVLIFITIVITSAK